MGSVLVINDRAHTFVCLTRQMLEAVQVIHDENVVHTDLKPANFVLVKGRLKLIDFGISKAIANDTTNIGRDQQIGTANYMPPEALIDSGLGRDGKRLMKVSPSTYVLMSLKAEPADAFHRLCSSVEQPTCGLSVASCIKWFMAEHHSPTFETSPTKSWRFRTRGTSSSLPTILARSTSVASL